MRKSVSSNMQFYEKEVKDGVTYFYKSPDYNEQYTLQDVIQQVTASIEEIGRVPGKKMHILVHVTKHIEEE